MQTHHKPERLTIAKSDILRMWLLKVNSYTFAVLGFSLAVVGIVYQDRWFILWFTAVSLMSFFFSKAVSVKSISKITPYAEFILTFTTMGSIFLLPQGPASALLFFIFVISVLVVSEKMKNIILLLSGGIIVMSAILYFDLTLYDTTNVPVWISFFTILTVYGSSLIFQYNNGRQSVEKSLNSLIKTESSIEAEKAEIIKQNQLLFEGNEALERGTMFLQDTLASEAKSTASLSQKLEDQERITRAIHQDMRQPLRGIVSFSQLIKRKLDNRPEADNVQEYLTFAIDGGQRMAKMLDDLFNYSKNNKKERAQEVNLNLLLKEVQHDLDDLVKRSNAQITVQHLPIILGFETQLKQLFQNLLSNALKFTQEGVSPSVVIRSSKQECSSKFVIEIEDNGVGIPENQLDKVFGLFNRAHKGQDYEGSGVGLALCRRISISHGGSLKVESEVGKGTIFRLELPVGSIVRTEILSDLYCELKPA